ncbi:MAG: hypothetical protein HY736_02020 [Verrucomicrobia bacterium]|nr:hypothetical protein [Verrucomicrobiota bacterium]
MNSTATKRFLPLALGAAVCYLAASLHAAAAQPDPNFIASPADLKARIPAQTSRCGSTSRDFLWITTA